MSRQKTITTEYLASMSGLTLEEQAVLFALIAQSDDEGRGLAQSKSGRFFGSRPGWLPSSPLAR